MLIPPEVMCLEELTEYNKTGGLHFFVGLYKENLYLSPTTDIMYWQPNYIECTDHIIFLCCERKDLEAIINATIMHFMSYTNIEDLEGTLRTYIEMSFNIHYEALNKPLKLRFTFGEED